MARWRVMISKEMNFTEFGISPIIRVAGKISDFYNFTGGKPQIHSPFFTGRV